MAPELLSSDSPQTRYSSAIDMYAVGILINALWSQEKPYKNVPFGALKLLQEVAEGYRPAIRADIPPSFKELAEKCWVTEPAERLSAEQLLSLGGLSPPLDATSPASVPAGGTALGGSGSDRSMMLQGGSSSGGRQQMDELLRQY